MENPQNSPKSKKAYVPKEVRDIAKGLASIGDSAVKVGEEAAKGVMEISKAGVKTGVAVSKGVYGVGRATVQTGVAVTQGVASLISLPYKKRRSIFDFFWRSKRGIITGAADNDPSGIVTYIQTGAAGGYNLLWLAPLAWPLLVVVEEMSARIGVVTKKGINRVIIENLGVSWAWLTMLIIIICNTLTIGADIAAMAEVGNILTKIPSIILILLLGALFIYVMYRNSYSVISRWLFLLTPIFLLYVVSSFLLDVSWVQAIKDTFLPPVASFNKNLAILAVGFLGTTITPFLVFWETTQEIEERQNIDHLKREKRGVITGMFFTQMITFFIVVAAAAAFAGKNHLIATARDAALALQPFGLLAFLFFSLGILGSGLIAIPVLSATTAYTFSETMDWSRGLNKSFSKAKGFYLIIFLSIIIGIFISLSGFNPILMLFYSQVFNGILMPILLVFLLVICNSKKIMGDYTNRFWTNFLGIVTILVNVLFVILMFLNWGK